MRDRELTELNFYMLELARQRIDQCQPVFELKLTNSVLQVCPFIDNDQKQKVQEINTKFEKDNLYLQSLTIVDAFLAAEAAAFDGSSHAAAAAAAAVAAVVAATTTTTADAVGDGNHSDMPTPTGSFDDFEAAAAAVAAVVAATTATTATTVPDAADAAASTVPAAAADEAAAASSAAGVAATSADAEAAAAVAAVVAATTATTATTVPDAADAAASTVPAAAADGAGAPEAGDDADAPAGAATGADATTPADAKAGTVNAPADAKTGADAAIWPGLVDKPVQKMQTAWKENEEAKTKAISDDESRTPSISYSHPIQTKTHEDLEKYILQATGIKIDIRSPQTSGSKRQEFAWSGGYDTEKHVQSSMDHENIRHFVRNEILIPILKELINIYLRSQDKKLRFKVKDQELVGTVFNSLHKKDQDDLLKVIDQRLDTILSLELHQIKKWRTKQEQDFKEKDYKYKDIYLILQKDQFESFDNKIKEILETLSKEAGTKPKQQRRELERASSALPHSTSSTSALPHSTSSTSSTSALPHSTSSTSSRRPVSA